MHSSVFGNFIDCHNPDILVGTESWLNSSIPVMKYFHLVHVFRRDRPTGHGGGVFIYCNKSFAIQEIPLTTDCEVVASP